MIHTCRHHLISLLFPVPSRHRIIGPSIEFVLFSWQIAINYKATHSRASMNHRIEQQVIKFRSHFWLHASPYQANMQDYLKVERIVDVCHRNTNKRWEDKHKGCSKSSGYLVSLLSRFETIERDSILFELTICGQWWSIEEQLSWKHNLLKNTIQRPTCWLVPSTYVNLESGSTAAETKSSSTRL